MTKATPRATAIMKTILTISSSLSVWPSSFILSLQIEGINPVLVSSYEVVFLRKLRIVIFELDVEEVGVSKEDLHDLWSVDIEERKVGNEHRGVEVNPKAF